MGTRSGMKGAVLLALATWAAPAAAQLACLPIARVDVRNVDLIAPADIAALVAPFEGRCLGLAEFDAILETVTLAYVDRGYVLSRAYLPEQDISDGVLDIAVIEGELAGIRINDAVRPVWQDAVFPGLIGRPVNIREIEQGLDQIEAMPRYTAAMDLEVGAEPGESILDVTAETPKPFEVRITGNNRGTAQSGEWNVGIEGDVSNLLGRNETWRFNAGQSVDGDAISLATEADTNRNASISAEFPDGRWSYLAQYEWSDYTLTIPGAAFPIGTDGFTRTVLGRATYLLRRDRTTKEYLAVEMRRSVSKNFIADVQIDASSRVLTSARLSYAISRPFLDGALDADVYVEKGLGFLNAQDAPDLPEGAPNPRFLRIGGRADYVRRLGGPNVPLTWNATLSAQISPDRLYGGQGFSIGGVSTVRGSKIALAQGSSGILWRNELDYELARQPAPWLDSARIYAALDVGRILPQDDLDIPRAGAVGAAIGVKLFGEGYAFDLSYQEIIAVTGGLQEPEGEIFANFTLTF